VVALTRVRDVRDGLAFHFELDVAAGAAAVVRDTLFDVFHKLLY
jgi:hypothetical protein